MATPFNIIAQLQLQAPANLNTIVSSIQSRLSSITATINLTISPTTITALGALTGQLNALNTVLATVNSSATAAAAALGPLGGSLSRVRSNTQQINSALVNTSPHFNQVATTARQAAGLLENFGVQAGLAARRYTAFLLAGGAIVGFVNELRNAVGEAVRFQREMTRLAQVGNDTAGSLKDIEGSITRLSVNLGVSSKDLLGVALQLRQAGLNASDTKIALDALAKSALAPSFGSLTDTTEGLISAMSQFKLTASDAEKTLGAINSVSTQYAVSSRDIIDAIRRTGGAFHAAGGSLNELIALFGAIRSTSRESAESIGSSLRTILVRTQRSDFIEDMHRLGIELRYTREEATRLGNTNLANQFVGPFEAVRRLSEGVKGLRSTDPRFAGISTELGGYRQISKTVPLLQEFAKAQEIYKTAQAGSNSLTKSAEEAQGAFLVKITKVKEEFSALIRTVTESKGFQVFLDIVLQITSGLNKLAGALTPLIPLLAGLAAFQLGRGTGRILGGFLAGVTGQSPRFATGGIVSGSGDGDTIPAMLEPGEFVIRKQAAHRLGYDTLHRMNSRGYAVGGVIKIEPPGGRVGMLTAETHVPPRDYSITAHKHSLSEPVYRGLSAKIGRPYDSADAISVNARTIVPQTGIPGNFKTRFEERVQRSLMEIANQEFNPPGAFNDEAQAAEVMRHVITSNALGRMFESIIHLSIGRQRPKSNQDNFDFNPPHTAGLAKQVGAPNIYTDAKYRDSYDARLSMLSKSAIALLRDTPGFTYSKPTLTGRQKEDIVGEAAGFGITARSKRGKSSIVPLSKTRKQFAHGGDVYDEFDPKERAWAKGWMNQYNTSPLTINKQLEQSDPTFNFFTAEDPNTYIIKNVPAALVPKFTSYKATGVGGQGPLAEHPELGKYVVPEYRASAPQAVRARAKAPPIPTGNNVYNVPPLYMVTAGSPQQGGHHQVIMKLSELSKKGEVSAEAIKLLSDKGIDTVVGGVNSYVLSSQALDVFYNEFVGPVHDAIRGVARNKFGSNLDFSLNNNQLKTLSGDLFEKYISGLFGVSLAKEKQAKLDFPSKFPDIEGLNKILSPKGPILGEEGDAKLSYSSEKPYQVVGKWLNKYRGIKFAEGGISKDTVPALLTPGEFVINREAAQRIGYGRLHAMNQEGVARYAKGGPVYMATGAQVAAGVLPEMRSAVGSYAASAGVNYFDVSEISKVQASVQALKKYYDEYVENVRQQLLASGVIKDNLEGTRIATAKAEKDFAKLGPTLLAAGIHTQAQLDKLGLTAAATAEGNIGGSLEARQKELEKTQGPLPIPTPAWYQAEMLAGSAAIPAAQAAHREAHGLTGGEELSALTKRQISAQALADNYDRMVKETSAELLATKQARSKVEADRLAVERAEAVHRKLAEEASLQVGTGDVRQQLGATAEAGGASYLTRGQQLRRGLRKTGRSLYKNRYGIAQIGVGLAAYYGGQALEAQAGTAEEAVLGGEATSSMYTNRKAVAGGIEGAVTGAAIGSQILPGWGTAIGGAVGAVGGFAMALVKAKEEILKSSNELAARRFGVAVGRFEKGEVGAEADIRTNLEQRNKSIIEKQSTFAYWLATAHPIGTEDPAVIKARQERDFREANAPYQQHEERLLNLAATRYAQNLGGRRGSIAEFTTGKVAGQSIETLIQDVAKGRGLGEHGEKIVREELQQQMRAGTSQLTSVREGAKVDAVARDFELLVLSARNAASGLNDLARATKVTEDLFAGTVSAIQFRPPAEALEQLGGPNPREFARSIKEIAAPFGERGAAFQSTALGLDEAQRRFSAGLPDMLKGYKVNPLQSGEQLADALEKTIRGGRKSPEMDPIIDAMKSKLVNIGEGKQIQELIANPDKLRRQIFGDLQQDVTRTGQELSKILEASANAFSAASARFQQQLAQIGKVIDEQAKLTGEAMQIRARGRAELAGNVGTLALNTPLATREYAYRAVQTRLTGQAGLGAAGAFDPVAIGRRQREIQDEILARREAIDKQPGIRGGPEWDAAVNKIHELEKVSGDLSQALQHLGQVSERNAAIEERLAVLRKDQEARTNIAEKYLTGDPAARMQLYRGRRYAETIAQGGDIQQMAPDAIKDLISFVQTAGGMITRDKAGTQITYTDLIHRAYQNTNIPGFGPTNVGKLEIARGVAEQARNVDVGEAALGQEARNMRRMANRQFGLLAPGGASDVNVRLNENMERLNQSVVELRKAIEAAEKVPIAEGAATGGLVKYYGFGSAIFKPKGTDIVPAMLTPNEYVVNAKSAQANKALLERINAAHGPVYLAAGGTASQQLVEQKVAAARQNYIDFLNKSKATDEYYEKNPGLPGQKIWELTKAERKAQLESEIRIAKSASYPGAPTVFQEEIEAVRARHRKRIIDIKIEGMRRHEDVGDLIEAEQDDERVELQRLRHDIAIRGRRNRGRGPQQPTDMPAKPALHGPALDKIIQPAKKTIVAEADPIKEMNKAIRATLPKHFRMGVDAFAKERPGAMDLAKTVQARNLRDPYSQESMMALYHRARRGGHGDIGSINALIDAAKRAQISEAGATAGMEGYRRGMGMVRSGRHIAGLGGGQYDWSTTGRATTQRIEKNLNFVKLAIEDDVKKHHHGADFTGLFDRLRLSRGHGVAANPTVHPGNFSMVLDEHNNIVGRLIPGSDYVITRLDKFNNLKIGQQVQFSKAQLERMVTDGTATHLHGNWRVSHMATGGMVHGSDSVHALLTPGEFVLNASAASSLGYNRLQTLNTRYLQEGGNPATYDTGNRAQVTSEPLGGVTTSRPSAVSPTGAGGNFGGDINRLSAAFTTFSTKVTEFANAVAKIPPSLAMTYNGNLNVNINGAEALAKIAEPLKDMVVTQATNAINHMISTRMGGEVPRLGGADMAAINIEPEGINRAK